MPLLAVPKASHNKSDQVSFCPNWHAACLDYSSPSICSGLIAPANVFYFDSILGYFSNNVRLIYIVRDGRDVVTSIHPSNPWASVDRWVQVIEHGYKYKNCSHVLTIKYEELITGFNRTVALISKHIGIDVNNQILDWHKHATIRNNKNLIGNTVNKLSSKSIHKFESKNFKYQKIIEEFMRNERAVHYLKMYNYSNI